MDSLMNAVAQLDRLNQPVHEIYSVDRFCGDVKHCLRRYVPHVADCACQ